MIPRRGNVIPSDPAGTSTSVSPSDNPYDRLTRHPLRLRTKENNRE